MEKDNGRQALKNAIGARTLSDRVQELIDSEELVDLLLKKKPQWLKALSSSTPGDVIIATLIGQAMSGNVRAIEVLNKIGYGDQVKLSADQGFFDQAKLTIEIVEPKHTKED